MIWIFLSVVLILAVVSKGFRKQLIWGVPLGIVIWFLVATPSMG